MINLTYIITYENAYNYNYFGSTYQSYIIINNQHISPDETRQYCINKMMSIIKMTNK